MKKDWKNLKGDFRIDLETFPDWEKYPNEGVSTYNDSKVIEFEFENKEKSYIVKCLVDVIYSRFFSAQTYETPEEDDIMNIAIYVDCIKGSDEDSKELSHNDLINIGNIINSEIELI